jgi:exodeoxyribonuclease-3
MKILSWNVNGLRAVHKKGFLSWLENCNADIICLQETKAQLEQFPNDLLKVANYQLYSNSAIKKGYAGVAVYTKQKPEKVEYKLGLGRFDQEGRIIKLTFPKFILFNFYLPHGGRQKENLDYKLEVYDTIFKIIDKIKDKNIILAGDFNIAHEEIDLANPKQNKNNIMFTENERKQISKLIKMGFIDSFRKFNSETGNYTWWPYAFNARERNLGWRIDYIFTSRSIEANLKFAFILNKINLSDHCPIGIEF